MKITANRAGLVQALSAVGSACAGRTTVEAYKLVKLEAAAGGALSVSATDGEVGVRFDLAGVTVARPGAALVDPGKLTALLRGSAAAEVSLESDGETMKLKTGPGKFSLPNSDPALLPAVESPAADEPYWTLTAGAIRGLTGRTVFAASRKEIDKSFTTAGVLIELCDKLATLVATDSVVMAFASCTAGPSAEEQIAEKAVVPAASFGLLNRCLGDDGEAVRVYVLDGGVVFRTERAVLRSPVLSGRFVPWRMIFEKAGGPLSAELPVGPVWSAVDQAAVLCDKEMRRLKLSFSPGRLVVSGSGPTSGEGDVEVPLPGSEIDLSYCCGADELRDYFGQLAANKVPAVTARFKDAKSMAVFKAGDWSFLIAPISA